MNTFATNSIGCKVNQYETQQVTELLTQLGLARVESNAKPDMLVLNTCCVTKTAASKSRQHIRKFQTQNPKALIVATGCLAVTNGEQLKKLGKNIFVIKNRQKIAAELTRIVNQATIYNSCIVQTDIRTENDPKIKPKNPRNQPKLPTLTSFAGHTRAFLKIQDGCDAFCTYCIIPTTRPIVHSKSTKKILAEAATLAAAGHKEIVITGIFLGAFGQSTTRRKHWPDGTTDALADLLEKLAQIPLLPRIRLSSLEPSDVTEKLLDCIARYDNIMPHLHLSLQSGSAAVLRRMGRQYSPADFTKKIALIRSTLDRPAITTDIIAGFPGETDTDFEATISLARDTGFSKMHIFPFSVRQGTPAEKLPDKVPANVIKRRAKVLRDLDIKLGMNFRSQFIGETAQVLIENTNDKPIGHAERYFTVTIENTNGNIKKNDLVDTKITSITNDGAIGELEK